MNIYDFKVKANNDDIISLEKYKGKVMLITNSATECGFTPQYEYLQNMYEQIGQDDFIILDFPCNQFGNQAPGSNAEIASFCESRYGITFPIFSKVEVNGENADPLYKYLVSQKGFAGFDEKHPLATVLESKLSIEKPNFKNEPDIKWNFTKFLVNKEGIVVDRFEPTTDLETVLQKVKDIL